jgi:hypothetical protein
MTSANGYVFAEQLTSFPQPWHMLSTGLSLIHRHRAGMRLHTRISPLKSFGSSESRI